MNMFQKIIDNITKMFIVDSTHYTKVWAVNETSKFGYMVWVIALLGLGFTLQSIQWSAL